MPPLTTHEPPISVIIPTHKRPDLLRLCLQSVARYAPKSAAIIVVDDGSPKGCASEVARSFPGVRCLRWPRRRGFCAAANAGVNLAPSPIIEMLNDDTEVTLGWAEAALDCFRDPLVGSVAPLVLHGHLNPGSSTQIDSAGDRYYLGGVAGKRGHGEFLGPKYLERGRVFGASASSAFYRRDVLLRVGGFPASFGAYFEDVDLAFRINRAGYRVMFEPRSLVFHRGNSSYGVPNRRVLELQSRNEERVFWRNLPRTAWKRAIRCHLAVLAGKAIRRWKEGHLIPYLCGRLRVLGEIRTLTHHRRMLTEIGPDCDPADWNVDSRYWT